MGCKSHLLLNQSTHSRVANATASKGFPRAAPVDDLGLVEAVDGFGQGVVLAVADGGFDPAASASRSVYLIEINWLPRSL